MALLVGRAPLKRKIECGLSLHSIDCIYATSVDPDDGGKRDDVAIETQSKGSLQDNEIDRVLSY
jgi:hypothetical protein